MSSSPTGMPRLLAISGLMLIRLKRLKHISHRIRIAASVMVSKMISLFVMLNMSPIKRLWYREKLPDTDKSTSPSATPHAEKTPMTVSVEESREFLIRFISSANTIANIIIAGLYSDRPSMTPIPTPVSEEWPRASEKNAIPLLTIRVPSIANSGMIRITARNAFRMNSYCHQPNNKSATAVSPFHCASGCEQPFEFAAFKNLVRTAGGFHPAVEQHHLVGVPADEIKVVRDNQYYHVAAFF